MDIVEIRQRNISHVFDVKIGRILIDDEDAGKRNMPNVTTTLTSSGPATGLTYTKKICPSSESSWVSGFSRKYWKSPFATGLTLKSTRRHSPKRIPGLIGPAVGRRSMRADASSNCAITTWAYVTTTISMAKITSHSNKFEHPNRAVSDNLWQRNVLFKDMTWCFWSINLAFYFTNSKIWW